MKKHIGSKIVVMIFVMIGLFVINIFISQTALTNSKNAFSELSGAYVDVQTHNADLESVVVYAKLYMNSMLHAASPEVSNIAMESQLENVEKMRGILEELRADCDSIGNENLSACYSEYEEALFGMCETIESVVDAAQTGQKSVVNKYIAHISDVYNLVDEKHAAFEEAVDSAINDMTASRIGEIYSSRNLSIAMAGVYLLGCAIIIFVIIITIAKPARNASEDLNRIIKKIENNEGDLTERVSVQTQDEVGQLAIGVNNFIDQLQEIMQTIQRESRNMTDSVDSITDRINNSNESATDVSATMQELSSSMEEVAASVENIAAGVQEVLDEAAKMSAQAKNGSEFVQEIKSRAEQIKSETISSKESTSQMISENRGSLQSSIENSKSVEKINELTDEILSISSQTNLLALNASIEAARAGEAGKGFAVVADEIRQLADSSRETANKIQDISNMVTKAVLELANNADEMLQFIDGQVLSDYDKFVDVAVSYNNDADSMDSILKEFYDGAQSLESTMDKMSGGIDGINSSVDESARGISTAAQSTNELVEALGEIKTEATTNKDISDLLSEEVDRFKNI